jgi:imidazolonepropionase-like amidohydrolase
LRAAAAPDSSAYARFFSTGPMFTVKGDTFADADAPMPETPAQAEAAVRDLKALGVDAIKIQLDDLSWAVKGSGTLMPVEVLAAAVKQAHTQGLKVYAHAPLLKLAKEALSVGVDGMMHGILDEPVDAEFLSLMRKNGAVYVPTLALFEDGRRWRRICAAPGRELGPSEIPAIGDLRAFYGRRRRAAD